MTEPAISCPVCPLDAPTAKLATTTRTPRLKTVHALTRHSPTTATTRASTTTTGTVCATNLKSLDAQMPRHATTSGVPPTTTGHALTTVSAAPIRLPATSMRMRFSTTARVSSQAALSWDAQTPWHATMTITPNTTTGHAPSFQKALAIAMATPWTPSACVVEIVTPMTTETACATMRKSPDAQVRLPATTTPPPPWTTDPATSFRV